MARKKSWSEKLNDDKDLPKIVEIPEKMRKRYGEGTMVIPAPREVNEIMRQVPKGKLITVNEIRQKLAAKHGTTIACPLTTGIFVWIAANAAEEAAREGAIDITPYWRTLKSGGFLNEKYPGSVERHRQLLESEGFQIIPKGKKWMVADYQKFLAE